MSQAELTAELGQAYAAGNLSFRNKIINGNFDWWQRGNSNTIGGYLADRWNLQLGPGTVISQQKVTPAIGQWWPGGKNAFNVNITNAGDAANGAAVLTQRIEGVDTLQGIITVSFTAAVQTAGMKIGVNFTQNFGTGGSPSTGVQLSPVVIQPSTMLGPRYSATFTLPSIVGKVLGSNGNDFLELEFYFTGGTNYGNAGTGAQTGQFYIGSVQVEAGPIATPLEVRHIGFELGLCYRYFEIGNIPPLYINGLGGGSGSIAMIFAHPFKVIKRALPAITYQNVSYYSGGNPTSISSGYAAADVNADVAGLYISSGTTNMMGLAGGQYIANAEL